MPFDGLVVGVTAFGRDDSWHEPAAINAASTSSTLLTTRIMRLFSLIEVLAQYVNVIAAKQEYSVSLV